MHAYGYVPDRHDDRDRRFSALRYGLTPLPPVVDYRPQAPPVRDQLDLGSCTAFAITGALELGHTLHGSRLATLSPLWLYWQERWMEHDVLRDAGAMPRAGLAVSRKVGCDTEQDWPYVPAKFAQHPPEDLTIAKAAKISGFYRIHNAIEIKQALAQKHPVVFGFAVYDSFESAAVAASGIVPVPNRDTEQLLGGHCMTLVGYSDPSQRLIARNSWSTNWGVGGYCLFPYPFFDPNLNFVQDIWAVVV